MRAFVLPHAGAGIIESAEVPVPTISDGEILVRVKAVGVGIHDSYFLPSDAAYPHPIGIEAAGIVDEVGRLVSVYRPGDRIAFVSSMQSKGGTWAEWVAVKADALVVPIPADLGFVEAAAVPVAGNTVLRTMHGLAAGSVPKSLFIAGGSGAIGTLAIQIAVRQGWRVAVSASEPNHDLVRSLGAELAVDYRDPRWTERIRQWVPGGVDAAIVVPPGVAADSLPVVRDGGRLIAVSGDRLISERGVQVGTVPYDVDVRDDVAQLLKQIAARELRVEIERVYPFAEAPAALAKVQTRHARGKIVLRLE